MDAAPALGLAAAAAWGAGDFLGGLAARRGSLVRVSLAAQLFGFLLLLFAALATNEAVPGAGTLALGAVAGLAGAVGLAALYAALARGRMGVAAPVSAAVSAGLPVLVAAVLLEGAPSAAKLLGFALALAGILLLARSEDPAAAAAGASVVPLALLAGAGFGALLILLDLAGEGGAVWWPLVAARAASSLALVGVALARADMGAPPRAALPSALGAGLFDALGNALYVAAAYFGRLDVAAVLASLYPATTVLLARLVLHERLTRAQWVAVGIVAVAVVLIAGPW